MKYKEFDPLMRCELADMCVESFIYNGCLLTSDWWRVIAPGSWDLFFTIVELDSSSIMRLLTSQETFNKCLTFGEFRSEIIKKKKKLYTNSNI